MTHEYHYSVETSPWGFVYRPLIEVLVSTTTASKKKRLSGLIDSGSDDCLMNTSAAAILGIALSSCKTTSIGGLGGAGQVGFLSNIRIRLEEFDYEFETPVVFLDSAPDLILGQSDFFKHFRILFERDKGTFKLTKVPRLK